MALRRAPDTPLLSFEPGLGAFRAALSSPRSLCVALSAELAGAHAQGVVRLLRAYRFFGLSGLP